MAPRTQVESELVRIWQEVLGIERIGITDNFFELGGHSLKAMLVTSRITKLLNRKITIKDILLNPSIEQLATITTENTNSAEETITHIEEQDYYKLSRWQEPLLFLSRVGKGNLSYNLNLALTIKGSLDFNALEKSFQSLVTQQENLRSYFVWIENKPKFRISPVDFNTNLIDIIDLRDNDKKDTQIKLIIKKEAKFGFDLEKGPLYRLKLIRVSKEKSIILISIHHSICDGWSLKIMRNHILSTYKLYKENKIENVKSLTINFKDYIGWLNNKSKSQEISKRGFEKNHLKEGIAKPNLPVDNRNFEQLNFIGQKTWFELEPDTIKNIYQLCEKYKVTLYVNLLTIFILFLAKVCRQEMITITIGNAGRNNLDFELIIGYFIQTYRINCFPNFNKPFKDLLLEVNKIHLEALNRDHYLHDEESNELQANNNKGFDVYFQLENYDAEMHPNSEIGFQVLDEGLSQGNNTAKFNLLLHAFENNNEVQFCFEYNSSLFKPDRIDLFTLFFRNLANQVVSDPRKSIGDYILSNGREPILFNQLNLSFSDITSAYPLTPVQRDIYLSCKIDPHNDIFRPLFYNLMLEHIDITAWKESISLVTEELPLLKSSILEKGEDVYLTIRKKVTPYFEYIDLTQDQIDKSQLPDILRKLKIINQNVKNEFVQHFLLRIGEDCFAYVLNVHHLIFDGFSGSILYNRVYNVYKERGEINYDRTVNEEKERVKSINKSIYKFDTDSAKSFWNEKLKNLSKITSNSFTKAEDEFVREKIFLNKESVKSIKSFCENHKISTPVYLKGIFVLLIRYYCRLKNDFLLRNIVSDRQGMELDMLGCFYSSLPVLIEEEIFSLDISIDKYFSFFSTQRKEVKKHRYISMLFQAQCVGEEFVKFYFNYLTFHRLDKDTQEHYVYDVVNFPKDQIHLIIRTFDECLQLELSYNKKTFYADKFLSRLRNISDQILNGAAFLNEIEFLLKDELTLKRQVKTKPNVTLIHRQFEEIVKSKPNSIAVVYKDQALTFGELNARSNCLADKLRNELKVSPGSCVGLMMLKTEKAIISILGILKAGAAYISIDPSHPPNRRSYIVKDSAIDTIIIDDERHLNQITDVRSIIFYKDFIQQYQNYSKDNLPHINNVEDSAYVIYTSGTTGKPKGVLIEHQNLMSLLFHHNFPFKFQQTDIWSVFHSLSFDFSVWEVFGGLLTGGKIVIIPSYIDTKTFSGLLYSEKITILNQVPSLFYRLQHEILNNKTHLTLPVKTVIFGGEALQPITIREWYTNYSNVKLINMYGITETTVHVTYKEIGPIEIEQGISNIGRPLGNLIMLIADEQGNVLPDGLVGEILISGYGLSRGYLNKIELTIEKFVTNPYDNNRFYKSGDIGRRLPNGDFEYLGRLDNQVKVRGYRIELGEIEQTVLRYQDVDAVATLVVNNASAENNIICYYVSGAGLSSFDLRERVAADLPSYLIPTHFIKLDQMPLTANGKIDKQSLPTPKSKVSSSRTLDPPNNEIEKLLLGIWQEILGQDEIGINDNFFEIGGDSLKIITLYQRMNEVYPDIVEIHNLFSFPTIRKIASFMRKDNDNVHKNKKAVKKIDF
ncbi:MAG: amino acid adenylation domain-containing protein [Cytophagales bacterium]|nr:amino acid adenylation domain-containing protein [Cytophagales bacterium]